MVIIKFFMATETFWKPANKVKYIKFKELKSENQKQTKKNNLSIF